eukprot:352986-Chlamydomonas_euryale.AAC.18
MGTAMCEHIIRLRPMRAPLQLQGELTSGPTSSWPCCDWEETNARGVSLSCTFRLVLEGALPVCQLRKLESDAAATAAFAIAASIASRPPYSSNAARTSEGGMYCSDVCSVSCEADARGGWPSRASDTEGQRQRAFVNPWGPSTALGPAAAAARPATRCSHSAATRMPADATAALAASFRSAEAPLAERLPRWGGSLLARAAARSVMFGSPVLTHAHACSARSQPQRLHRRCGARSAAAPPPPPSYCCSS